MINVYNEVYSIKRRNEKTFLAIIKKYIRAEEEINLVLSHNHSNHILLHFIKA